MRERSTPEIPSLKSWVCQLGMQLGMQKRIFLSTSLGGKKPLFS